MFKMTGIIMIHLHGENKVNNLKILVGASKIIVIIQDGEEIIK